MVAKYLYISIYQCSGTVTRFTDRSGPVLGQFVVVTRRGASMEVVSLSSKALRRTASSTFPDAFIIVFAGYHGLYWTVHNFYRSFVC